MEPLIDRKLDIAHPYRLAPGEILVKLLINHPYYFTSQDNGQLVIQIPNHANPENPGAYIIYSLTHNPLTNDSIMLNEFSQEEAEVIIEVYKFINRIPGRFYIQEIINAAAVAERDAIERNRLFPDDKPDIDDPLVLEPAEALIKLIRRLPGVLQESDDGKVLI